MYILVAAFKDEVAPLIESEKDHLVISGLGKLNSLMTITEQFQKQNKPIECVINLGTAGSDRIAPGSLVEVTKSYQRDTAFFSESIPLQKQTELISVGCGTGDRLEASQGQDPWDIVDMELFALAFYCQRKNIPLVSIKYVTDRNDDLAYKDWKEQLPIASQTLSHFWMTQKQKLLAQLCPKSSQKT